MNDQIYLLAKRLGELLLAKHLQIATAESCTGGAVAQAITDIPGSSAWFDRGFVTYSNLSKIQMLGVSELMLSEFGAVSEPTIKAMLAGALLKSVADCAIAVSGIAGPSGGTPDKPVGTVHMGWVRKPDTIITEQQLFSGNRDEIRSQALVFILKMAIQALCK